MRETIIAFLLLIGSAFATSAFQEPAESQKIEFQVQIKKPVGNGMPVPKGPVIIPDVYLDDHTLYIDSIGEDSFIELTDGSDSLVYSCFVPDGTTTVSLPTTLVGTYGLSLIPETGCYYFYSEIMF